MNANNSTLRVLVVDDEQLIRAHVRNLLRQMGITDVVEADSGKSALDVLLDVDQVFPDLIISDLHMDGMDGIEFCNTVRRTEMLHNVGVPIIMVTAEDDPFILNVSEQVGALSIAKKPIDLEQLEQLVASYVNIPVAATS
ncbi:MAG: response regulator [Rhodospirillales bacterium]|nr:response regulator [Rhodospirillales bacterium]